MIKAKLSLLTPCLLLMLQGETRLQVTSCALFIPLPPSLLSNASIESFTLSKLKFGICMHYIFTRARTNPLNCGRNCQDVSCGKVRALSSCIARSKGASQSVTQVHTHTHTDTATTVNQLMNNIYLYFSLLILNIA